MKLIAVFAFISLQTLLTGCLQEDVEYNTDQVSPARTATDPREQKPASRPHPATTEPSLTTHDPIPSSTTPIQQSAPSASELLADWFSVRSNYEIVVSDVRQFYAPVRYNGCVAFISAALRRIGVPIPISSGSKESPSLVTRPFFQFLERELGWKRIGSADNLSPGDIVFTQDNTSYPGYPAHTYMFKTWSRKSMGIALVIDNQGFSHERNIYDNDAEFNFTPFAFALRAP